MMSTIVGNMAVAAIANALAVFDLVKRMRS